MHHRRLYFHLSLFISCIGHTITKSFVVCCLNNDCYDAIKRMCGFSNFYITVFYGLKSLNENPHGTYWYKLQTKQPK